MELGSVPVRRHWKHDVSRESSFWFSFSLYLFVYDSFTQKVSLLISFFFFVCLLFSLRTDDSYDQTSESVIFISPFPLFTEKKSVLGFLQEAKLTWKKLERVHGSRGLNAQPHVDFIKVAELSQLHYIATSSLAYNTPAPHSKMSKTKKKKLKFISVSYYSPFYRHLICSLWQCCIGNFIHSTSGWRQRANGPVEQL